MVGPGLDKNFRLHKLVELDADAEEFGPASWRCFGTMAVNAAKQSQQYNRMDVVAVFQEVCVFGGGRDTGHARRNEAHRRCQNRWTTTKMNGSQHFSALRRRRQRNATMLGHRALAWGARALSDLVLRRPSTANDIPPGRHRQQPASFTYIAR